MRSQYQLPGEHGTDDDYRNGDDSVWKAAALQRQGLHSFRNLAAAATAEWRDS